MKRALACALALAGCVENPKDQPQRPPPAAPGTAAPSPAAPAAPSTPPPLPELAEVEMTGTVALPKGVTGSVLLFITDGDCWKPGTRSMGRTRTDSDRWAIEVFVPQGTKLHVCGGLVPAVAKAGDPARFTTYGEAAKGPFLAQGAGEVIFNEVTVALKPGPAVDAPPTAANANSRPIPEKKR
jgi:hypothetical protein